MKTSETVLLDCAAKVIGRSHQTKLHLKGLINVYM